MKKINIWVAIVLCNSTLLFGQTEAVQNPLSVSSDRTGNPILLGKTNINALQQPPFSTWFKMNYDAYTLDTACCNLLTTKTKDLSFMLFFGSWCGDSKRNVPVMVKVLDSLKIKGNPCELIAVSNQNDMYKKSPSHEEQGKNIVRVPTLIVYRSGREIGRIIESPVETIERDLLAILLGLPYKPNYHGVE